MICKNPIIIGGSGSSGSTLLISILNRHPLIAGGPELSLLNKSYFFDNPYIKIKKESKKITKKGLCTNGWFLYPKIHFKKYIYSDKEFQNLIEKAESQKELLDNFFIQYLLKKQKSIWAEKTPSNSYCFKQLLELYPKARIIHIYRDGKDVITSLIKRGMSPYFASMLWLYNTSFALMFKNHPNYYEIKYEDLVGNPKKVIVELCNFLNIDFSEKMLNTQSKTNVKIDTWNNTPDSKISNNSVGNYKSFLTKYHLYIFSKSRISNKHVKKYKLPFSSSYEIQKALGYQFTNIKITKPKRIAFFLGLLFQFLKDIVERQYILIKYDRRFLPYPGKIIF